MDLGEFRGTLAQGEPPEGLSFALQTLWWDAKGDWDRAHQCAQKDEGKTGSAVPPICIAGGDMRNAGGSFSRAGREPPTGRWSRNGSRWRKKCWRCRRFDRRRGTRWRHDAAVHDVL